ncbi:hypothetical protein CVT24_010126 [Panaeolus cyanescens]|uniref:FACT complex subunit POB3 n=1 Tax=Panaeolus cyanescens TaxID=181874 RepID=A0A409W9J0_9AGAR|nr:hypothetical protein CVT24_010126 [Panaeolus cyanescens]
MVVEFDRIYHGLLPEVGKLRLAPSGVAWKGNDGTLRSFTSQSIKWAQWMPQEQQVITVSSSFISSDSSSQDSERFSKEKFDGFESEDHDRVQKLFKEYFSITLENREVSFRGWNWGITDFQGQDLAFMVQDRTVFELPLNHVANSNIAGKTEVSLEFSNLTPSGQKSKVQMGDELTEIRFYVPGTITKLKSGSSSKVKVKGSDAGSNAEEEGDDAADDEEIEEEEISSAQVFHDTIKERANISQMMGKMILSFEEVLVLTPRGRYDMEMFPDFLRLRGRTYDYKVLYQSIARLFLLPKDDMHVLFILGLSTPIRQGQTLYQYLVMQFTREEEITAELNISQSDIDTKYEGKLKKSYEAPTYEVISSVFRSLAQKKIIGSGSFQSRDGHPGLKANLKAIAGDLFFLERYIFFVSKTPLLIELSEISSIVFSRISPGGASSAATSTTTGRTFDMRIVTKNGPEHAFTSLNKEEYELTQAFLRDKGVRVKSEMVPDADLLLGDVGDDDDDESMQSVLSDSEDDGGRRKKKKEVMVKRGADLDEDSEDDEDFAASDSDSGSPSDTDSSSGAETASDASGDLALTKGAKKKAPVKKKAAAKKADGDDNDNEDKPKPKPKPKPKAKGKEKDDDKMDVDDDAEGASKPKPKPKPKAKPAPKEDKMDVDDEGAEKPKPKPKPKPKAVAKKKDDGEDDEPPKKKVKKAD